MNLDTARQQIRTCRESMDALYQKPVFDEWVIVSLVKGRAVVHAYDGPRAEKFEKNLHADSAPLYAEMQGRQYSPGDFEFVDMAKSSRFDACVKLGPSLYLLCNNTYGTMADLRQDARWRQAQRPFVELTEKFRADPLKV